MIIVGFLPTFIGIILETSCVFCWMAGSVTYAES